MTEIPEELVKKIADELECCGLPQLAEPTVRFVLEALAETHEIRPRPKGKKYHLTASEVLSGLSMTETLCKAAEACMKRIIREALFEWAKKRRLDSSSSKPSASDSQA